MKNQSGITLIALAITIIVLFITISMSLYYGIQNFQEARKSNYSSELNIVAQAVAEQYIKIVELGLDKAYVKDPGEDNQATIINNDNNPNSGKPEIFIGTRQSFADTVENHDFMGNNTMLLNRTSSKSVYERDENGVVKTPRELLYVKCYYRLSQDDLAKLRIRVGEEADADSTKNLEFLVNYYTGEVFNIIKKEYYVGVKKGAGDSLEQTNINPSTANFDDTVTDTSTIKDYDDVNGIY